MPIVLIDDQLPLHLNYTYNRVSTTDVIVHVQYVLN